MPRPLRIAYPGARHHVMNRGARREPVFYDDVSRNTFITFLAELPERFGVLIHAYALMPNHYHLLVESTQGRLSDGMAFLGSRYTQWVNAVHPNWDGPLFRGRFRSKEVVNEQHWHYLPIYLHLNPLRSQLAMRLSQMPAGALRAIAEGLLEITY